MKKVMIVGAGLGQVNLLRICQQRNYDVFVVSIPGEYPCFQLTDNIRFADISDKDAVLKIAQEEKIDAVLSDQNDLSVSTVAYVAEKMGLRGIGYETALKFTDKYLMRKAAKKAGIAVPEFYHVRTLNEAIEVAKRMEFPIIIKPVDGWSSRGVFKVNSISEIMSIFNDSVNQSIKKEVIVEEFIHGDEYLADGFAMDYTYYNLDVGVKEHFKIENLFVSSMCMFSSAKRVKDGVKNEVLLANKKLVKSFGLEFGITHAEYIYNQKNNKVYLVEVAARGGGVYLSTDITPKATGFDTNNALVDYVVEGKKRFPDEDKMLSRVSAWKCFALPEGEIISIDKVEEVNHINGVYKFITSNLYRGKRNLCLRDDNGKYGPVLIVADDEEDCYRVIEKVKKTLKISVKTAHGIEGIIW